MTVVEKRRLRIRQLEDDILAECEKGLSGEGGDIDRVREMRKEWKELVDLEHWRLLRKIK
jgi:hypothetical protein